MTVHVLLEILKKQIILHQHLYKLSLKKTDILKTNNIESLNDHLKEEQKYVKAIQQLEGNRKSAINDIVGNNTEAITDISGVLKFLQEKDQEELLKYKEKLLDQIEKLKNQNDLNQKLLEHSLQFVNLSMDLINPQPETYNYGHPDRDEKLGHKGRSLFDSQA